VTTLWLPDQNSSVKLPVNPPKVLLKTLENWSFRIPVLDVRFGELEHILVGRKVGLNFKLNYITQSTWRDRVKAVTQFN
jgi:hypothetical protein